MEKKDIYYYPNLYKNFLQKKDDLKEESGKFCIQGQRLIQKRELLCQQLGFPEFGSTHHSSSVSFARLSFEFPPTQPSQKTIGGLLPTHNISCGQL